MAILPGPDSDRWRGWSLVALLLLTLVLTGVLAYEALNAAQSHRRAAENALRDYAAFAAWQFGRAAEDELGCRLHQSLHPIAYDHDGHDVGWWYPGEMPRPAAPDTTDCACRELSPRYYFRVDLSGGALRTSGETLTAATRAWIADTIAAYARMTRRSGSGWGEPLLIGTVDGRTHLLLFHVERGDEGAPLAAYGLGADPEELVPALREVAKTATLLPPSLVGELANDALLSVRVFAGDLTVFASSEHPYSPVYAATDTLPGDLGALSARIVLRPATAGQLVIGGLPESKLPLLLGLLALVVGLVVIALHQLRRQYELARLRSDFVSGVSHELRTPLAQVRMFAETLLLGRVRSEGERRRALAIINQEATRLTHLVENVLRFSRAERDASRVDPEPVALAPELREAIESFTPVADACAVTLRAELDEEVVAPADREALRQMLLNLLDNATKYGPAGQTVTVGLVLSEDDARLWVEDEGPGVPPGERERIFDAYHRLERDAESAVGGSGIGLAVVRELAERHGGSVRVENTPDGGARFTIELLGASRRPRTPDGEWTEERREPVEVAA